MSLKNQPEFEQDTDSTTTSNTETTLANTQEQTMTKTIDQTAAASVVATTAIAKAATGTSVGAVRTQFQAAFKDYKDVFDTTTVSALSQATPRITAEQGALRKDRTTKLGSNVTLEVVSWNHRWAIGCGEQNQNDEMKQLFRVSYDNKTIDGEGCSMHDYIESLKAQGYSKAKASPYGDLFGYIVAVDGKAIPPGDRELVLVQMSATSLGNFTAFCVSRGILESKGLIQPSELLEVHAQDQTKGSTAYTNMTFKAHKA